MDITIYSTSTCADCRGLTNWLDSQNISYKKILTDQDPAGMAEYLKINDGVLIVPFTIIKDTDGNITKIIDNDQAKFKQVLGIG